MDSKHALESEVWRLGEIQPWWHDIELPYGVRTIGRKEDDLKLNHNNVKWHKIRSKIDFRDRSIVDLGCNEGAYCLEAEQRGATRVIGIDINEHRIEKARFVAKTLDRSGIKYEQMNVYDVSADTLGGKCELALALGLLHRVPDPYGLIVKTAELADTIIFEWQALDSASAVMSFWGGGFKEYDRDNTGYWKMSRQCVLEILHRTPISHYWHVEATAARAVLAATCHPESSPFACRWRSLDESLTSDTKDSRLFGKIRRRLHRAG